ncbi:protein MIS12 homolog [Linepithema humile]|uniref:protein MIS12 homolog n=1 Tax=Linepithema humile TaxID=83485 RepID=UPI0006235910|nr:PREDICTED: protein MIS12 homolog [Linepithema humile]
MENVAEESSNRKREEYEMQLLGFHSTTLYAAFKNTVMERIQSTSRKLREALEKSYKISDSEKLETLKMNEKNLIKAYYTASLPYLKNIKRNVNKTIAIPSNVLLSTDKPQATQYTEEELEIIRKELNELQQKAKQATILDAALKEELQLIEQSSICAHNIDRLSHIIESGASCPDVSNKILQLAKNYKQFSSFFDDKTPVLPKSHYNIIDDVKCIDVDIENL